ncbi:MAG: Tim44-like domain-containing protein [Methylohalobius crimeensis]
MPKLTLALSTMALGIVFLLAPIEDAEAKRFGGGRSFGGKSFYSTPYKRSQLQQRRTTSQKKAAQTNQSARQSWRNRGGLLGWMAPLLIGGLLGSLFFGGAFEHLNLADFLIFGGLAMLAFKFLARRSQPVEEAPYGGAASEPGYRRDPSPATGSRPFDTDLLFKHGDSVSKSPIPASLTAVPADFHVEQFLEEVKHLFRQLQDAWNRDELADIRGLTTDEVFMGIKAQKDMDGNGPFTEVLALEAQLLDYQETPDTQEAAVLFDAELQEAQQTPEKVQEIWHFVRSKRHFRPAWILDGIQQIEASS